MIGMRGYEPGKPTTSVSSFTSGIRSSFQPLRSLNDSKSVAVISHILVGLASICWTSRQKGTWGDGHDVPLSHPLSKVTKCCILSTDPYDNTVCAAFEQQVNLLSLWALNSWTIHPSQASFWTQKCVCLSHSCITNAAWEDLSSLKLSFACASLHSCALPESRETTK